VIAGAFGLGAADARDRLRRLGEAAGFGGARVVERGDGAVAAWDATPAGLLDEARGIACLGIRLPSDDGGDLTSWASRQRGALALAGVDAASFVLARGMFGGRSLFYAREANGRRVVACSRLEPLVATLEADRALDPQGLAACVAWRTGRDASRTSFAAIRRVLSGEALTFRRADAEPTRASLWRDADPLDASPDDAADGIRAAFTRAVARAIGDARRIGVLVSGGVDSSSILATAVALARGASPREIHAINLHFGGVGDDRPYMRELASALGIEPICIDPTTSGEASNVDTLVIDARPLPNMTGVWGIHMAKFARERGVDVVLLGTGGDDLFEGDDRIFDPWSSRADAARAAMQVARLKGVHWAPSLRERMQALVLRPMIRGALPPRARAALRRFRAHSGATPYAWAGPELRRYFDERDARSEAWPPAGAPTSSERIREIALGGDLLDYRDGCAQIEIAASCPTADPFFDPELTGLAARIPAPMFFHGDRVRGLFRHAIRGLVPESIRLRETKGRFENAFAAQLEGMGGARALEPLVAVRGLAARGIVDAAMYRERFERLMRDPRDGGSWIELWPAIATEAFVQRYAG
jgi:asparagine synthase (glutamine-hydrolysing)